jgi:hypothetical protein
LANLTLAPSLTSTAADVLGNENATTGGMSVMGMASMLPLSTGPLLSPMAIRIAPSLRLNKPRTALTDITGALRAARKSSLPSEIPGRINPPRMRGPLNQIRIYHLSSSTIAAAAAIAITIFLILFSSLPLPVWAGLQGLGIEALLPILRRPIPFAVRIMLA